ncbi:hypothetical protein [Mucilaginibacter dorajii]|uniref:Uncharacterized protein n=1 Tax=Mucilaginibacter dorajii TaxID=692994 RepID=A0ABP7PVE9_9SPHI|nr:hypothetical protein [Mucilaginibacter dorajii]MCS3734939.1 hypothetical protein [Mucilaginibacter dorajii]
MNKIHIATIAFCIVATNALKAQTGISASGITSGTGMVYNLASKENTKGSRYLFDTWAKGYVVDKTGNTVKNDNYSFNYDKINGSLLLSQDKQTAIDVSKDQVKTFTVYDKADQPLNFEYVPAIDATHFVQALSTGSKYKVYKLTKTTLVKADFKSDGMTSSGNKFDEYVDEPGYYVIDVKTNGVQRWH